MQVFASNGNPALTVVYSGITASTAFDASLLQPPTKRALKFSGAGANVPYPGEVITGLTGAATATIDKVALVSGSYAGGTGAGVLYIYKQSGTFQAENIDHTNGATDDATIAENSFELPRGLQCRTALITVETADLRFVLDGTTATVTGGVNPGHLMSSGQSFIISDFEAMKKWRMINAVASNGAVAVVSFYF